MPSGSRKLSGKCLATSSGTNGISQPFLLPDDEVRGVGGVDDVGGADVAGKFLVDPLEQPLRAGALDLHWRCRDTRPRTPCRAFRRPAGPSRSRRSTLPSFFAASTSAGVIATGAGACGADGGGEHGCRRRARPTPCRMSRLESFGPSIASSRFRFSLPAQRPAAVGRQRQPDLAAFFAPWSRSAW